MYEYRGKMRPTKNFRVAIVAARFNEMITKSLLSGALECLNGYNVNEENISVAWVPGAFEIPVVAQRFAESGEYDAVICLGAVIRGATAHFDYVAGPAASNLSSISVQTGIPVIFGVITTDTIEQAIERAGTKCGNKGFEAAMGAVEMVSLLEQLPERRREAVEIS